MDGYNLQILAISETNWNGHGSFKTDNNKTVLFSGKEEGEYSHGVAVIFEKEISKSLIGYSPINDRIIKLKIQARPHNISIIQCYAPTSLATENEMNEFCDCLQSTMDTIPNRDVRIIMGNFNAKVGKETANSACRKFGLGSQNERGEDLIDFCISNNLA